MVPGLRHRWGAWLTTAVRSRGQVMLRGGPTRGGPRSQWAGGRPRRNGTCACAWWARCAGTRVHHEHPPPSPGRTVLPLTRSLSGCRRGRSSSRRVAVSLRQSRRKGTSGCTSSPGACLRRVVLGPGRVSVGLGPTSDTMVLLKWGLGDASADSDQAVRPETATRPRVPPPTLCAAASRRRGETDPAVRPGGIRQDDTPGGLAWGDTR